MLQVRRSVPITYPEVWEVEPYSARLRWHRAYIPQYYSTKPHRYRIEMQEADSTTNDWKPVATGVDKTEHTVNNISPRKDYNFRIRAELENGDFSEPTPPIQYHRTKSDEKPLIGSEELATDKTMDGEVNGSEPIPKDFERPLSKDRPASDNLTQESDRTLRKDLCDPDDSQSDNEQPKPRRKSRFLEKVRARRESLTRDGNGTEELLKDKDKPKRKSRFLSKDRSTKDIDQPLDKDLYGKDDLTKDLESPAVKSRYGLSDLKKEYGDLYSRERYGNEEQLKKEFESSINKEKYGTDDLLKDIDTPKRKSRYGSNDLNEDLDIPKRRSRYTSDDLTEDFDRPLSKDRYGTSELQKDKDPPKRLSRYGIEDLSKEYDELYGKDRYGNGEIKNELDRQLRRSWSGIDNLLKDTDHYKRKSWNGDDEKSPDFERPLPTDRFDYNDSCEDYDRPTRKNKYTTDDLMKDYERPARKSRYNNDDVFKDLDSPVSKSRYTTDDLLKDFERPSRKDRYGTDDLLEDFDRSTYKSRYSTDNSIEDLERPSYKSRYGTDTSTEDFDRPSYKSRYGTDSTTEDDDRPSYKSRYRSETSLEDDERPSYKSRYRTETSPEDFDRPSYKSRYGTDSTTEDDDRPSYKSRYRTDTSLEDFDRPSYKSRYGTDRTTEDDGRPSYNSRYLTDTSLEDDERPSYKSRYRSETSPEDLDDRPSYKSRYGTDNLSEVLGDDSDFVPMRRNSISEYQPIELDATTMNRPYIDRLTKYVPPRMPIDKPDMVTLNPESVELAWKQAREVEAIRHTSNLTYTIEVRNPPSFEWRELVSGLKSRSHVIDNLHPRIDYVFRVKAWNNYGSSEPSLPVSLYRPKEYYSDEEDDEEWEREFESRFGCQEEGEEYYEEPPIEEVPPKLPMDTPEIVTQTPDSIWFEWQPARIPVYATKTPITYVVEIKEPPCTQWKRDVSGLVDTKYVREGLDPTKDYHIRVRAESEFGISEPTLAIIIQRPLSSRPGSRLSSMEREELALSTSYIENITTGVPPRMSATRPISSNSRPDGLTLSWSACRVPSYIKKSSVTYIIEKREPPGHIWSPFAKDIKETKYNITGLDPEQDYMFRVRARNDFGTSDASLPLTIYRERDDYVPQRIRSRSGSRDSIQVLLNRRRSMSVDYASSVKSEEDMEVDSTLPDKAPFQPEYVTTTYDTQYGVDGRKGKISLKVKAHPMPTVHWYFGEEKLQYGDRYNTYITPQGQITLEINNVSPDCVGDYKCYAENASGAAVKVIKFVMAEPPTVLEPLEDRLVNAYQNIMLKCRVDIPLESTIKWMKDWRPLADSTRIQTTHTKPDTYTLEITNAVPSDSGVYSCLIENQAGKVTLTSRLTIEEDVPVIPEVNLRNAAIEDYYHVLEEIGRGQHGVVRRVVEMSTGKSYAANFMYMRSRAQKNFFLSEFESLRSIIHVDGVLHLHDAFETDRSLIFVTEILTGPELLPQMVADGNWTEAKVASVVKKLLTIVKDIHAAEILHLDIKPSNIRLCGPENTDVKLINFALARFLHPEEDITHNYGSVGYASPEQINSDVVNRKTDMWAVGVLAYVLLSGSLPFQGETDVDILKASMEGTWSFDDKLFENVTPDAKDFISKLLVKNKKERMSVEKCLAHPWLETQSAAVINTDNIKQYNNMDKLKRDAGKLYTTAHLQSLMKVQHGTNALYQPAIDVDSGEIIFPDSDEYGDYLDEDSWLEWQLQYQDDPDSQEFKIQDKKFTVRECKHTAAGPRPKEDKDKEPECESLCFVNKVQTTSFEPGDDIVLTCSVVSKKEPPVVTWYRDETLLNEAYRTETEFDEETGIAVLTVTNAKEYDTGVYKCVARNKDGRITCQARLLLGEKPGQPGRPVVTQLSGTEAFLTWMGPLTDGNSYILGYRIDYRKQGDDTWTRGPYVTEEYGIVSGLLPNTGYIFRVSCHNKYGTSPYSIASLEATTLDQDAPKVSIGIDLQPLMQFTTFSKQQLILPAESRRPSLEHLKEEVKLQQANPEDNFDLGDVLSKGSYGEYRKCTEKGTKKPYVMKVVPYSEEKHDSATREFEFLRKLQQSHIISVGDSYVNGDSFYMVFEHLSGMNILQYICLRKSYRETLVATVVTQVLDALEYLHHLDIAHCNLQPSSIVMATLRRPYVKLRDFTYAQNIVTSQQKLPMAGYPDCIAPEVIKGEPAGFCPDLWALGTLTFILLSGVSPFAGNKLKDTLSNILFDRFCMSDLYDNVTKDSIKFVSRLLKRLPKNRTTIGQCLKSRWLQLSDSMLKAKNNASFSTERLRDYSKLYLDRRYDTEYMNLADVVITELPRPTTGPAVQPILSDRVVNRHVVNIRVSKSKSKSASPVKQVKKSKAGVSQQLDKDNLFKIPTEDSVDGSDQKVAQNINPDSASKNKQTSPYDTLVEEELLEQTRPTLNSTPLSSEEHVTLQSNTEHVKDTTTEPDSKLKEETIQSIPLNETVQKEMNEVSQITQEKTIKSTDNVVTESQTKGEEKSVEETLLPKTQDKENKDEIQSKDINVDNKAEHSTNKKENVSKNQGEVAPETNISNNEIEKKQCLPENEKKDNNVEDNNLTEEKTEGNAIEKQNVNKETEGETASQQIPDMQSKGIEENVLVPESSSKSKGQIESISDKENQQGKSNKKASHDIKNSKSQTTDEECSEKQTNTKSPKEKTTSKKQEKENNITDQATSSDVKTDDEIEKHVKKKKPDKTDKDTKTKEKSSSKKDKSKSKKKSEKEKHKSMTENSNVENEQTADNTKQDQIPTIANENESLKVKINTDERKIDKQSEAQLEKDIEEKVSIKPTDQKHEGKFCPKEEQMKGMKKIEAKHNDEETKETDVELDKPEDKKIDHQESEKKEQEIKIKENALPEDQALEPKSEASCISNKDNKLPEKEIDQVDSKEFVDECTKSNLQQEEHLPETASKCDTNESEGTTVDKSALTEALNPEKETVEGSRQISSNEIPANESNKDELKEVVEECIVETVKTQETVIEKEQFPMAESDETECKPLDACAADDRNTNLNKIVSDSEQISEETEIEQNDSNIPNKDDLPKDECEVQDVQSAKDNGILSKDQETCTKTSEQQVLREPDDQEQLELKSQSTNVEEESVKDNCTVVMSEELEESSASKIDTDLRDLKSENDDKSEKLNGCCEMNNETANPTENDQIDSSEIDKIDKTESQSEISDESAVKQIEECVDLAYKNNEQYIERIEEVSKKIVEKAIHDSLEKLKDELSTYDLKKDTDLTNKVKPSEKDENVSTTQSDDSMKLDEGVKGVDSTDISQKDTNIDSTESAQELVCDSQNENDVELIENEPLDNVSTEIDSEMNAPIEEEIINPSIKQKDECSVENIEQLYSNISSKELDKLAEKKASEITSAAIEELTSALQQRHEHFEESNKIEETLSDLTQTKVESTKMSENVSDSATPCIEAVSKETDNDANKIEHFEEMNKYNQNENSHDNENIQKTSELNNKDIISEGNKNEEIGKNEEKSVDVNSNDEIAKTNEEEDSKVEQTENSDLIKENETESEKCVDSIKPCDTEHIEPIENKTDEAASSGEFESKEVKEPAVSGEEKNSTIENEKGNDQVTEEDEEPDEEDIARQMAQRAILEDAMLFC